MYLVDDRRRISYFYTGQSLPDFKVLNLVNTSFYMLFEKLQVIYSKSFRRSLIFICSLELGL